MDGFTFTVEMTKSLAWPVAAVVIALLFRKRLSELLKTIKKGKIGSAEFEFERAVNAVVESVPDLPATPTPAATIQSAATNPRGAILEAWLKIQEQAFKLATVRNLIAPGRPVAPFKVIQEVANTGLLSPRHAQALKELSQLRNRAAHSIDFSPDPDAVLNYVMLANNLADELKRLTPETSCTSGG